jgi:hypothetical protein
MFPRRAVMAMLSTALLFAASPGTAGAAEPLPSTEGERPLTPDEQAASDRKLAAAAAYIATVEAHGLNLVGLDCVTPTGGAQGVEPQACAVPQGFLSVSARDQIKSHYCGPAVGQVIANYSWKMASSANKYSQSKIAGWMQTDIRGSTSAPELEDGLEAGTAGSPRRPAGWDWVVTPLEDSDHDGTTGDQLHAMVRANISGSKMPVAIAVKPHDASDPFHLTSWVRPVTSVGHWIAGYGWVGLWTGTDYSRLYYTDSSKDEGGATGKFWDPMRHIAVMIMDHTRRLVW